MKQEIYPVNLHSLKHDVKNIPRSRTKGGSLTWCVAYTKKSLKWQIRRMNFLNGPFCLIVKEGFREEDSGVRLRARSRRLCFAHGKCGVGQTKKGKIFAELGKSFSRRGGWSGFYADCDFLAVIAKR